MSARLAIACLLLTRLLRVCGAAGRGVQAGALFAGLLMVDSPFAKKAHACMQPLTSLFGGMYLGSLGMIVNPVRGGGVSETKNLCAITLESPRGSGVCTMCSRFLSSVFLFLLVIVMFVLLGPVVVIVVVVAVAVGLVVLLLLVLLLFF